MYNPPINYYLLKVVFFFPGVTYANHNEKKNC